jgi:hypothetical protein
MRASIAMTPGGAFNSIRRFIRFKRPAYNSSGQTNLMFFMAIT